MKNELQNEIANTREELLKALDLFDQKSINLIPFQGSWTGGQVAEHILKSIQGILQTIKGPVKTTQRNPEEHVKQLGDIFLNMDIKMKSPDFIIPSVQPKDKAALCRELASTLEQIKQVAGNDELGATCTGFDMPVLGGLTRTEWISFASFHTRRHTQQLKNIASHLQTQVA